jgi:cytochrome c5
VKKLAVVALVLILVLALAAGVALHWADGKVAESVDRRFDAHRQDFPIPPPLTAAELDALRAEHAATAAEAPTDAPAVDPLAALDLDAIAAERSAARGQHLVESRYGCVECHGVDFGGGVMIDDPAIGLLRGPNLTLGSGGRTAAWTAADWDRKVRHGVEPSGAGGWMPTDDFAGMSDQELADVITWIRSRPPVDSPYVPPALGPLGKVLVATGELTLPAERYAARTEHPGLPPATAATAEFGAHLAGICTGCHRAGLEGGPIPGAPPGWAPAANLTIGPGGTFGTYSLETFDRLIRTGLRPDGDSVRAPMDLMAKYGAKMTPIEVEALFLHIKSLPPMPTGR